jgi:serine/threonine protein kinase
MTSEKWEQAKQLYEAALKVGRDERPRFLAENCGGDEELRREVGSLLACSDEAEGFLDKPAIGEMAEVIVTGRSLTGQKILQYNIVEMLGAGGMGEVYLAEDTRLKRKIALKILPASLSEDKKSVRRFEQEACAASALNHPNILTVHEFGAHDGMNFIASEFVKGETLRERLIGGETLTLPETLDIALQVAAALCAAHESGIIHRDIKPENVMIRDDGLVKVLDFGLAKLTLQKSEDVDNDGETVFHTTAGMIMGTAAYMSPEQARGRETDARTDIWSFGVVLYEMLAGKPLFKGETASDTIASILTRDPGPVDNLPAKLNHILRKALQKDRGERYQTMEDLLLDLDAFKRESASGRIEINAAEDRPGSNTGPVTTARSQPSKRKWMAAIALLIALAGAGVVWRTVFQNKNPASANLLASLRPRQLISLNGEAGEGDAGARFSPDGTMIAYSWTKDGQKYIWTKQIPEGKPNPITDGKWNDHNPVWSPDGQQIAFISNRDDQMAIWTTPFSGGALTLVNPVEAADIFLLKWSKDGQKIYYRQVDSKGGLNIFALDLTSKQPTQLTNFDSSNPAQYFSISPDEDRIAYSSGPNEKLHIFVMPLGGGEPVQVTSDEASDEYPFWLPDGRRIIYSSKRDDIFQTCVAYLDEGRTKQINLGTSDTLIRDVSSERDRILFQQSREESDLWKIGINNKSEKQVTFESGLELWPDVSPDGKSVVFQAANESKHLLEGSIQIRSIGDTQPITIASNGFSPEFSPDGRKVAFLRDAGHFRNLLITDRNGAGERQLTTDGISFEGYTQIPYNRLQVNDYGWSPDSRSLVYSAKKDGLWNVWQAAADGTGAPRQISNNADENILFSCPIFAPDGKRIAWTSSAIKASADGKKTTELYLFNGETSAPLFSAGSVFRLIGWAGSNLLIAIPDNKSVAKPVNVLLSLVSAENVSRDLASIDAGYFYNIQLSPDGRRIAFAEREDKKDNIRVISATGGGITKITANLDPTTYIAGIAWSPDGQTIYFSKQKQMVAISIIENFK